MWLRSSWLFGVTLLASASWVLEARAQTSPNEAALAPARTPESSPALRTRNGKVSQARAHPAEPPIASHKKRPLPDYDGRGPEPTRAGDILIWVPRIALSPLYLVSEFGLRRPLGWLVTTAERNKLPALFIDFLTFGPERNAGVIPTGLIDFGFKPSVGLYFFWNEFLADNNRLRARAATWGEDWLRLSLANRTEVLPGHEIGIRAEFLRRPDWVFYGLGPNSLRSNRGRYGSTQREVSMNYSADLWRSSSAQAFVGLRSVDFDPEKSCCSDDSAAERIAQGRYPEPVALDEGYFVLEQGLALALDTRHPRLTSPVTRASDLVEAPGSGVRLQLRGVHAASLDKRRPFSNSAPLRYEWLRYGATLGGFVDLTGEQRTLGLSLVADFADPLRHRSGVFGASAVPFTEQVTLGGDRPLRGFLQGRLIDRSAFAAVLEYQWPVWVWLDGALHYAIGNVFGEHGSGFAAERLRNSFGFGVRSNTARDHPFEFLVALGTRTFEQGTEIDHVRLVFGATTGF